MRPVVHVGRVLLLAAAGALAVSCISEDTAPAISVATDAGEPVSVSMETVDDPPPLPNDLPWLKGMERIGPTVDVTVDSDQPDGPYTVEFSYLPADDDVVFLILFDKESAGWVPLETEIDTERGVVSATVPHLSLIDLIRVANDKLERWLTAGEAALVDLPEVDIPSCATVRELSASLRSHLTAPPVLACVEPVEGTDSGRALLKVVNNRNFTIRIQTLYRDVKRNGAGPFLEEVAALSTDIIGAGWTLIPREGSLDIYLEYTPGAAGKQIFELRSDRAIQFVDLFVAIIETMFPTGPPKDATLEGIHCLWEMHRAGELGGSPFQAGQALVGCLDVVWKRAGWGLAERIWTGVTISRTLVRLMEVYWEVPEFRSLPIGELTVSITPGGTSTSTNPSSTTSSFLTTSTTITTTTTETEAGATAGWNLERGDPSRSAWNIPNSPAPPLRQLGTVEDLVGVHPLFGSGMIFVSFRDGPGALSNDGQVVWRDNEGRKGSPAALVGETLILERGFEGLHARDIQSGQELWNYNSSSTSRGSGLATAGGELVWGGQVIDSATGTFLRELNTVWCWSDWKAASESTLFSPSLREIAVCDPASGALIERFNIGNGVIRYPVYADGVIYAATGKPSVIAVSLATGEVLAEVALDERTRTGVAVGEGRVYAAAITGLVTAHALPDLTPAWSQDLGSSSPSPLTVAGGRLWTTTEDNRLVALDAATGALVWDGQLGFDAGGVLKAEVVVAGGMVLVMETGCSRCRLQAWGRP